MKTYPEIIDSPLSNGQAHLQVIDETFSYRGEKYTYKHCNYKDAETGIEFTTETMDFDNLEQVYAQYRLRHGIPSPAELKETRDKYGLSALKMSEVLGLGVNQYRRYEDGEMPSEAIGKMLRSIETPTTFFGYVENAKNQFEAAEYDKICRKVQKSFVDNVKSRPDFSWLREWFSPNWMRGKVAL